MSPAQEPTIERIRLEQSFGVEGVVVTECNCELEVCICSIVTKENELTVLGVITDVHTQLILPNAMAGNGWDGIERRCQTIPVEVERRKSQAA